MAINPGGATKQVIITADADLLPADMPDASNTFKWNFIADEFLGINWEGGIPDFVAGLQPDLSDLRVGAIGDDWTLANAWGLHQFSQVPGSSKLVISGVAKSTYPLSSSVDTQFGLWRGCTDALGTENKAGVVPVADGWAGYWAAEDLAGPLADWTGRNALAETGSVTHQQSGKVGSAIELSGAGQYARKANPVGMPTGDVPFTMMAWVYPHDVAAIRVVMGMVDNAPGAGTNAVMLIYQNDLWCSYGYSDIHTDGDVLAPNAWALVTIVKTPGNTATTTTIYVDGTPRATVGGGTTTQLNPTALEIGAGWWDDPGASPFDGRIDEAQIHSVARSANWIASYYNMTSANGTFWAIGPEQPVGGLVLPRRFNAGFNPNLNPGVN